MKTKVNKIVIDKNGWPVEFIKGKKITNFLRKLIHGHHYECRECWYGKQASKVSKDIGLSSKSH